MIRLVAAVLVVVAAVATPATAAGGQGGLAGLRLVYDIGRDTFADDRLVAPVEALGGALAGGGLDPGMSVGSLRFDHADAGFDFRTRELLLLSIEAIGRRLAGMDIEAVLRTQGDDRLVLTLAGPDAAEAQAVLAHGDDFLGLHLVAATIAAGSPDPIPAGLRAVRDPADPGLVLLIEAEPVLGFADFAAATVAIDEFVAQPIVVFELTSAGATLFAEATAANVGRRMAIIVDGIAVSAPTVQEPITGGTGVITGNLTRDEAEALAAAINAGGRPAPLELAEVRAIGVASPPAPPSTDRGALAVEVMLEEAGALDPAELAAAVRRLGLGKAAVQRLDGSDHAAIVTFGVPAGGQDGRTKAIARLAEVLEGRYRIRAVWELGPLFVLEAGEGFVPAG